MPLDLTKIDGSGMYGRIVIDMYELHSVHVEQMIRDHYEDNPCLMTRRWDQSIFYHSV